MSVKPPSLYARLTWVMENYRLPGDEGVVKDAFETIHGSNYSRKFVQEIIKQVAKCGYVKSDPIDYGNDRDYDLHITNQ